MRIKFNTYEIINFTFFYKFHRPRYDAIWLENEKTNEWNLTIRCILTIVSCFINHRVIFVSFLCHFHVNFCVIFGSFFCHFASFRVTIKFHFVSFLCHFCVIFVSFLRESIGSSGNWNGYVSIANWAITSRYVTVVPIHCAEINIEILIIIDNINMINYD